MIVGGKLRLRNKHLNNDAKHEIDDGLKKGGMFERNGNFIECIVPFNMMKIQDYLDILNMIKPYLYKRCSGYFLALDKDFNQLKLIFDSSDKKISFIKDSSEYRFDTYYNRKSKLF